MKKFLSLLLILLSLLSVAHGQQMDHVADQADIFTLEQTQALESRMRGIYEKYDFDTVIVTTNNSRGQSARMYAADFYDDFRSYADYPNGLLFSFNFDLGEYNEVTRGLAYTIFTSQGEDALDRLLRPYLSNKNYLGAMEAYLDSVEQRLERFAVTDTDGMVTLGTTMRAPGLSQAARMAADYLPYMLIGGLVIGLLVALYMKSKLLIAKPQRSADRYALPGSLQLYDSSDIFLYQTVTRTRIQQNKSGGGGGGGGGSTFRSSGGGSYGSRGGKL